MSVRMDGKLKLNFIWIPKIVISEIIHSRKQTEKDMRQDPFKIHCFKVHFKCSCSTNDLCGCTNQHLSLVSSIFATLLTPTKVPSGFRHDRIKTDFGMRSRRAIQNLTWPFVTCITSWLYLKEEIFICCYQHFVNFVATVLEGLSRLVFIEWCPGELVPSSSVDSDKTGKIQPI